jgi:tetratricopeptide (TPR) repeat protein
MQFLFRRAAVALAVCLSLLLAATAFLHSRAAQSVSAAAQKSAAHGDAAEAYRLNTLGVAYMNQQRPADAQKLFEQSLAADPKFEVARLNLGISLLAQQKLEAARTALAAAAEKLPQDPYAWYNLGLTYKDLGDAEKGVDAFTHVTQIANEADPWYFLGYLNSQLLHYDLAIAAFQKALALFPFHASAEFGLARAYQRSGNAEAAKEHLAKFQKMTAEHLGTPFGAGYGDQGRFSLAELPRSSAQNAPPAIRVRFTAQPISSIVQQAVATFAQIGPSTGACFFDYDGDGKPDLFLVSATADGSSRLLRNLVISITTATPISPCASPMASASFTITALENSKTSPKKLAFAAQKAVPALLLSTTITTAISISTSRCNPRRRPHPKQEPTIFSGGTTATARSLTSAWKQRLALTQPAEAS